MKKIWFHLALTLLIAALLAGCSVAEPIQTQQTTPTTATVQETSAVDLYTYRETITEVPACYSPHDWYSDAESRVLEYTSMGLYAAVIDPEGDGYCFQPEMAAGDPVDISGAYNLPAGCAYQIDLNPNAVWEDGTPINADTYVFSMQQLLSSDAKHYRAAAYFSGRLSIAGAYEYYMQNQAGQTIYRSLADAGYASAAEAINDGYTTLYLDMAGFWNLDCGWQTIDSNKRFRDDSVDESSAEAYVTPSYLYTTYLADGAPFSSYQTTFVGLAETTIPQTAWADVGFQKTGEYQITLILDKAITPAELKWELTSSFLVKEDLYGFDYGTDPAQYASCGPYKLTSATESELIFEKNQRWYGYSDENHSGQYQATGISCRILSEADALSAFEAGELDTVTVDSGSNALIIPQTYTSKLTFNTSAPALSRREAPGVNKTLLTSSAFRQAISLSIDRQAFVESCVPTATPALGLLNETFLSDLSTGECYRTSSPGQQVLLDLYGADNIASITGYDPDEARTLLQQAYDAALAAGSIHESDVVQLEFLTYSDDVVYQDIIAFLQKAMDEAAAGTSLEGRIQIVMTPNSNYYDAAKAGEFDIILSTWGGSAADPYSILSCYCDREKSFEYGFDPSGELCSITQGDTAVSKTYRGWYETLIGPELAGPQLPARNQLLAQLEYQLLREFRCVPIYERNLLLQDSARILRPVDTALPLVGFGGVRYAQFTEDDAGNRG